MTVASDYRAATAAELAAAVCERRVSAVEIVTEALAVLAEEEPRVNAFVTVTAEEAIRESAAIDAGRTDGPAPFAGVPIALKDNLETAGVRTTYGSRALRDYVPQVDDGLVTRLRRAGFVVIGKTAMPELGTLPVTVSALHGVTRNPWDPSRTPGGSSGGAAAAVAAGVCPVALATDGGGSTRVPASCCGLIGLKPSRGRVSWGPVRAEVLGPLATPGLLGRTVADVAAVLAVVAGGLPGDPVVLPPLDGDPATWTTAPRRLRVAWTSTAPFGDDVHPACAAAVGATAELLDRLGHQVEEAAPSWSDRGWATDFGTVFQTVTAFRPHLDRTELEPRNAMLTEAAEASSSMAYARAVEGLHAFSRRVLSLWEHYDVLLTPTLAAPPLPVDWIGVDLDPQEQLARGRSWSPFAKLANITGQPAVSIPAAEHDGLPIGVQLVGRVGDEPTLLRLAAELEAARPAVRPAPFRPRG